MCNAVLQIMFFQEIRYNTIWFQRGKQTGQIKVQMTQGLILEISLWQLTK